jgi:hypothetical protein
MSSRRETHSPRRLFGHSAPELIAVTAFTLFSSIDLAFKIGAGAAALPFLGWIAHSIVMSRAVVAWDDALKCPVCHGHAVSMENKLGLGPAKSIPCRRCGAAISVSWAGIVIFWPSLFGVGQLVAVGWSVPTFMLAAGAVPISFCC